MAARIPSKDGLLGSRWLRPFAHRLTHPILWRFNRWSVSRGVALGFFAGLLLPFGQTPVAALLALTARANLIVAAVATFITNPITNAPIFYGAYKTGQALLRTDPDSAWDPTASTLVNAIAWFIQVSGPTALGLLIFAIVGGLVGYAGAQLGWRLWVQRRWLRRCREREAAPGGA
ncbi:MAG: DUF2062 domain-containing protein [Allosphingosinicella sp.]|uniref:DUF2062 domain-containing protein n=1 Tax=Allosphingosinicella sp. TaxID=2823234 RepID=UPI00394ADF4B